MLQAARRDRTIDPRCWLGGSRIHGSTEDELRRFVYQLQPGSKEAIRRPVAGCGVAIAVSFNLGAETSGRVRISRSALDAIRAVAQSAQLGFIASLP